MAPSAGGTAGGVARVVDFQPLERATLSSRIRDQVADRIRSGALAPGDRVPSERDLAEQFGVARTSVREAIQALVSLGLIERRGNRSFVPEHLPDVRLGEGAAGASDVRHVFETRRILEPSLVRLAVVRADREQRAGVARVAERFTPGLSPRGFRDLDRQFHVLIGRAGGNPLLAELYTKVLDRWWCLPDVERLITGRRRRDEVRGLVTASSKQHAALARALTHGDEHAALDAATAHLAEVDRVLVAPHAG